MNTNKETIVLGGGCFWCTEAVFKMLKGVQSVTPGYAGGVVPNPSYEDVCTGATGHAEVVRVEYDPSQISLKDLLIVFFATHDPTTPDRQGADIGTQYRSIILYTNERQQKEAKDFIRQINDSHPEGAPVITQVEPLQMFYGAEDYHLDYYKKNPTQPYCQIVINPKLEKVQKEFGYLLNTSE